MTTVLEKKSENSTVKNASDKLFCLFLGVGIGTVMCFIPGRKASYDKGFMDGRIYQEKHMASLKQKNPEHTVVKDSKDSSPENIEKLDTSATNGDVSEAVKQYKVRPAIARQEQHSSQVQSNTMK